MEKYNKLRQQIKTGDIILYRRNKGILPNLIQWIDSAYYNHTGIAYWLGERLFTIDAWSNGTELVPMSRRMDTYDDFCLVRQKDVSISQMRVAISNLYNRIEKDEPYGYWGLILRLIHIKLKKKEYHRLAAIVKKIAGSRIYPVCSDVSCDCGIDEGNESYKKIELPSPEDLIRYVDPNTTDILFNDKSPKQYL